MQPNYNLQYRLLGGFFLLLGLGALYWQFYLPIQAAANGAYYVDYSVSTIVAGCLGTIMGIFFLVFGADIREELEKGQKNPVVLIVVGVIAFAISFGCGFLMDYIMAYLGYE
jgi:uncharacterized membrane protein